MFAERLEADHRELDALYEDAMHALGAGDVVAALANVDYFWARLAMHIRAEHLHLFPAAALIAENGPVIDHLRSDHNLFMEDLANAMKLLRAAKNVEQTEDLDKARTILTTLGGLLAEHNILEEKSIYTQAGLDLSDSELADLVRSIDKELSNLPQRFSQDRI